MKSEEYQTIYWSSIDYNGNKYTLAKNKNGLCYFSSPNETFEHLRVFLEKRFKFLNLVEDHEELLPYVVEIVDYFNGKRTSFSVSIHLDGTPFQKQVWALLCDIPYGQTVSYQQIAERIGNPNAVRAVASAIGANPVLILVPCHRVIGKNGRLTGYRGGLDMKKYLLNLEGSKYSPI